MSAKPSLSVLNDPQAPALTDRFYNEHHNWLMSLLRKRLGHDGDAADLAHDVFVRLLVRPRCFDSREGARAWLSTVAHGMCVDLWRRRELEAAWQQALAARPEEHHPSPERGVLALETLLEIDAMLRELPDRVAKAFLMSQVLGMTYLEIARELGVSDRSVKKYMAQAMLALIVREASLDEQAGRA